MSTAQDASELDLARLWSRRALACGARTALIHGEGVISFRDLDRWSDELALAARAAGVRPGDVLVILAERSAGAVAAILATAKCGASYLPLEPHLPTSRKQSILHEVQPAATFLLDDASRAALQELPAIHGLPVIDYRPDAKGAAIAVASPVDWPAYPRDIPFYLLYTSGSSGAPKGVVGTQRGLLNRLEWMRRTFPFAAAERAAHRTALGFVDSVAEIWGALLEGVPLVVVEPAAVADVEEFIGVIARNKVTRLVMVPSLLRTVLSTGLPLAQKWSALCCCISSGESLPRTLAADFARALPGCRLLNLYGMTEAAADASWHEVDAQASQDSVAIGRPIDGMRIELLDVLLNEVAPGEGGHVHLGGAGLALGYYGRPALTALSFVPDPDPGHPGERLYATGDHARYTADGELEYIGRKDDQVKVRGHRIELREIERRAREHPAVSDCAALVSGETSEDIQLFAAIRPQMELTPAEMKAFLAERLPRYMIPTFVHVRDQLPALPNGKIDRQALVAAVGPGSSAGEPPATEAETTIALIWQELLRSVAPARHSSFLDLGGNSLKAALAVTRLRTSFGVELSVPEFLDMADLAQVAQVLEQRAALKRVLQGQHAHSVVETVDF